MTSNHQQTEHWPLEPEPWAPETLPLWLCIAWSIVLHVVVGMALAGCLLWHWCVLGGLVLFLCNRTHAALLRLHFHQQHPNCP